MTLLTTGPPTITTTAIVDADVASVDWRGKSTVRRWMPHFHVLEQSASRMLRTGDLTFTRVVTAGGASFMLGASPWVIPPSWHLSIIEFRDQLSPRRFMRLADRSRRDIEIRRLYHQIVDAIVNPRLPTLENTDGDPIEMTTMIYDLGLTPAESFDGLRPLAHSAERRTSTTNATTLRAGSKRRC